MFFEKKNYKIKPNFVSPTDDLELMATALLSLVTQEEEHKSAFIAGVISHWVFDEDNGVFLPKEKGIKWMEKRISSGDSEALAAEIRQAIEVSLRDDRDRVINRLFGIEE